MKDLWLTNRDFSQQVKITFPAEINLLLKREINAFIRWLRKSYCFPQKLKIFFCRESSILSYVSTEECYSSIFFPKSRFQHPVIRIAIGDFDEYVLERGTINAICDCFFSIARMIDFYYQYQQYASQDNYEFDKKRASKKGKQIVYAFLKTHEIWLR